MPASERNAAPGPLDDRLDDPAKRRPPATRRARWAPLAALALATLGMLLFPAVRRFHGGPLVLAASLESAIKLGLCAVAVLVAALARRDASGRAGAPLVCAAALCVAAYFNFGLFHGAAFVHHWDQFHYVLGAKYFPELGYDGLYVASLGAEADMREDGRVQSVARDLRTYRVERVDKLIPHMQEVWRRFTPERWQEFAADNAFFVNADSPAYMTGIRKDHGFNATPTWTFVARLLLPDRPIGEGTLIALGLLDVVLMAALFAAIFWTYGSRIACLCLLLFGLGYANRFSWLGGAFLRLDWIAAVGIAVCLLERKRHFAAGALVGYATMVRLFPLLFLFGPAMLAARALLRGERPRWALSLGLGFVTAVSLGLLAGGATGRGLQAWTDFSRNIAIHADTWLTNNVGLDVLFLYDRDILDRSDVDWSLPEPWLRVQKTIRERSEERRLPILAARFALLALLAAGVWRASLAQATVAGMVAIFSLASPTCYYWVALILLPLSRSRSVVVGALLLNLALYGVDLLYPAFEMRYGFMSLGLALLFLAWLASGVLSRRPSREELRVDWTAADASAESS